jgi:hypothetical protein
VESNPPTCDAPGQAAAGRVTINPTLIHLFHCDLDATERSALRSALTRVPGTDEGRAQLWEKFLLNEANVFIGRCAPDSPRAFEMAFFVFFEVRLHRVSSAREFFVLAAGAFFPSQNLTETSFPQLEHFAAMLQCQSMAVSTPRPGLVAKLLKMPGWFLVREEHGEWLLRKRLGANLANL